VAEDFATYADGLLPADRWEVGGLGWIVRGGRLHCEAGSRSTAWPSAAPYVREGVFEAVIRPERAVGTEWKTAGIAIQQDDGNFWQLALVEGPDTSGKPHSVELHEMLRGRWLANLEAPTALRRVAEEGAGMTWAYGYEYRMRLHITPGGIVGSIEEIGSSNAYRIEYAFSGDYVGSGRPVLVSSGLHASYSTYRAEIAATAQPPKPPAAKAYTLPPMSSVRRKATGLFRVEKIGDRWWVIDPKGYAFYVVGTDHVNYYAHWCEKLGYAPYSRNVQAKYGSEERWAASAAARLKQWGFNTLGAGHSESVRYRGLAHTVFLTLGASFTAYGDIAPRTTWTGFPDVFDPRWPEYCAIEARRQCAPHRNDPWLLGYFLDNELEWFGKNGSETGLVDEAMKKPAGHPGKAAFVAMLRQKYGTPERLNEAWKTGYTSWDELAAATQIPSQGAAVLRDRLEFVRKIAERYFTATCKAIREADPNHMILGCRFAGFAPPIWDIAGAHLDIVSVNYYGTVDLERGTTTDMPAAMARYHAQARRPLMITEWSFPALDAGLPSLHGAGQRVPTQKDKARAYAIYQTALFSMPYMVGSDYFMWVDQPPLGISSTFPEDSNYGLVDVNDRPWPELTATASKVNRRAVTLHSGKSAEVSARVDASGITIRNSGNLAASFAADVWIQCNRTRHNLSVPPMGIRRLKIPQGRLALVQVELDPDGVLTERRLDDNKAPQVVGPQPKPPCIIVVNPTAEKLRSVPLAVVLSGKAGAYRVADSSGRAVACQWDRLPSGDELAFRVNELPARSVTVLRLQPGSAPVSATATGGPLEIADVLHLKAAETSGNLLDTIALGDTRLGRLALLVHQTNGQPLWVQPDTAVETKTFTGPVRTVRLAVFEGGSAEGARTQAEAEGGYAALRNQPHRYRLQARMDAFPAEQWIAVRMLEITNTDAAPWRLESYFVYPLSAIGGDASDDEPGGPGESPRWYDSRADASYGAVLDTRLFRGSFWKDPPPGQGEHPDISRAVQRTLKPGETFRPKPPDPPVRVFGAKGNSSAPSCPVIQRLKALDRVQTIVRLQPSANVPASQK